MFRKDKLVSSGHYNISPLSRAADQYRIIVIFKGTTGPKRGDAEGHSQGRVEKVSARQCRPTLDQGPQAK